MITLNAQPTACAVVAKSAAVVDAANSIISSGQSRCLPAGAMEPEYVIAAYYELFLTRPAKPE
jgi:hypothetical protein